MKKNIFLAIALILLVFASVATFAQSQIEWIRTPTVAWQTETSLTTKEIFDESQLVLPTTPTTELAFSKLLRPDNSVISFLNTTTIYQFSDPQEFALNIEKIDPSDALYISSGTETCQKIFDGTATIATAQVSGQEIILPQENLAANTAFEIHPTSADLSEEMRVKISKINGTKISSLANGTQTTFFGCQKLINASTKTTIQFGITSATPTSCGTITQCLANLGKTFAQKLFQ